MAKLTLSRSLTSPALPALSCPAGLRQRVEAHLGGPLDEEPQVRVAALP